MPSTPPLTAFLMTDKGHAFLEAAVVRHRALFALVVIGEDATLDDDRHTDIAALCDAHGIAWTTRRDFTAAGAQIASPYALAIAWRWLIRHPQERLIVFHDSLLPRYRGFNPLVSCLLNRETRIGVSAIFGADDFDTGDILFQSASEIRYPITLAEAIRTINGNYVEAGMQVLDALASGTPLRGTPQDPAAVSYSLWRDEEDYRIDWSRSAEYLERFVDALGSPYKGASCMIDGRLARVYAARALPDVPIENRTAGKQLFVRDGKPVVVCGSGLLRIDRLVDAADGADLLPLSKYRVRFG